jgi:F0F1-type ATP synthase membrane subunit b/b'
MNRILFLLMALLLIAFSPPFSLASDQTQQAAAPDTQQKEQYEKSMEERLGNIGKQLDELREKANARTEEARKELNQYMKDAQKKHEAAARKLEEVRKATNETWKKFTSDMNKAADDFEQAYEKARKRFKE